MRTSVDAREKEREGGDITHTFTRAHTETTHRGIRPFPALRTWPESVDFSLVYMTVQDNIDSSPALRQLAMHRLKISNRQTVIAELAQPVVPHTETEPHTSCLVPIEQLYHPSANMITKPPLALLPNYAMASRRQEKSR